MKIFNYSILFLLFIFRVSTYKTSIYINTNFKTKCDAINYLTKPTFFMGYLKHVST